MPPSLPPEFTALYRLFLRATSAAVLHNRPALKSLRKTYRHSFEAAASAIKCTHAESSSPEGVENAKRWLAEFDTRITNTLELLHNSALSRGLPHRVVSRLNFLARSNYGWSMGHYHTPAILWNPQLPPNSPEYKIRPPSEIPGGKKKVEKRAEDMQLNSAAWGPLGEVIQMAEGRDGLVLGRPILYLFGGTLPQRPFTIPPLLRSAEEMSGATNDATQASYRSINEPVFFEIDFGDGAIQHVARSDSVDHEENPAERKSSLLSDDEFEPIRMSIAKRVPEPSEIIKKHPERGDTLLPPDDAARSIESSESDESRISPPKSGPGTHPLSRAPTSASSSTLFSVSSSVSASSTYVNHPKSDGRMFYKFDDCTPRTVPVVVTPDSVTGTRGLTNLRSHGYDFDWSRLAARTDAAHGLSPEDSAELEMFLSKGAGHLTLGPNSDPAAPAKASPKKNSFEKKLRDVLKMGK
ncbi:hypothetical protein M0805_004708 [Coniferiporia weirii]|nr:hypothetical protein M0805_004708 [Coniferiporia weirii]